MGLGMWLSALRGPSSRGPGGGAASGAPAATANAATPAQQQPTVSGPSTAPLETLDVSSTANTWLQMNDAAGTPAATGSTGGSTLQIEPNLPVTAATASAATAQNQTADPHEKPTAAAQHGAHLIPGQKTCPKCSQVKPSSQFYKNRANSDGLASYCTVCQSAVAAASKAKSKSTKVRCKQDFWWAAWCILQLEVALCMHLPDLSCTSAMPRHTAHPHSRSLCCLTADQRRGLQAVLPLPADQAHS